MRANRSAVPADTDPSPGSTGLFAAIDFETADDGRDSACALAITIVDGTEIVAEDYFLIQPPRQYFIYTYIHGITWRDVVDQPQFSGHWPRISQLLAGVEFIAAHNAGFDRSVLYHCCHAAGLARPAHDFHCTVKLARQAWGVKPTTLPDVCRHLGISLRHHQAESDARACAKIVIAARQQGLPMSRLLGKFSGRLPETEVDLPSFKAR